MSLNGAESMRKKYLKIATIAASTVALSCVIATGAVLWKDWDLIHARRLANKFLSASNTRERSQSAEKLCDLYNENPKRYQTIFFSTIDDSLIKDSLLPYTMIYTLGSQSYIQLNRDALFKEIDILLSAQNTEDPEHSEANKWQWISDDITRLECKGPSKMNWQYYTSKEFSYSELIILEKICAQGMNWISEKKPTIEQHSYQRSSGKYAKFFEPHPADSVIISTVFSAYICGKEDEFVRTYLNQERYERLKRVAADKKLYEFIDLYCDEENTKSR